MKNYSNIKNQILWLITARSGSKKIPDKNIKLLQGIPLLAYRIKTALSLALSEHVWCSTDSIFYSDIARENGANVPFLRPENLANDNASSADVVLHAMMHAESLGKNYKYLVLLEPTSPFIYKRDIVAAIEKLANNDIANSIVAVKEARPNTIFIQDENIYLKKIANNLSEHKLLGRQHFKKQISPSGGFYICKWDSFKKFRTFYTETTLSYLIPEECSVEIDEEIDWYWAEFLLEKKIIEINKLY